MFEIGIESSFEARHALRGDFGPASQPHSHTYRVQVSTSGHELKPDGTLLDITRLQAALRDALAPLIGANLNDVPDLSEPNPTAEVVARHVYHRIAPTVPGFRLTVRVWESPEAYASYTEDAS